MKKLFSVICPVFHGHCAVGFPMSKPQMKCSYLIHFVFLIYGAGAMWYLSKRKICCGT